MSKLHRRITKIHNERYVAETFHRSQIDNGRIKTTIIESTDAFATREAAEEYTRSLLDKDTEQKEE